MRGVRGAGYAFGGIVDAAHQHGELFHRVVHRVGNGAGDVFRHRGADGQVAVGEVAHFVHQPQNGALRRVGGRFRHAALLVGLVAATGALVVEGLDHEDQHHQGDGTENRRRKRSDILFADFLVVGLDQVFGVGRHCAPACLQGGAGTARLHQGLQIAGKAGDQRLHGRQALRQSRVGGSQFLRGGDILRQLHRHCLIEAGRGRQLRRGAQDALGQEGQFRACTRGVDHRRTALQGFLGQAADRDEAVFLGQDQVDDIGLLAPGVAQGIEYGSGLGAGGRDLEAAHLAAFDQAFEQGAEVVARVAQFGEAFLLPLHRGDRGLGDLLGQRGDLAGHREMGDAAAGGLVLHKDCGDGDQQADQEYRAEDAELGVDIETADKRQLALTAAILRRNRSACRARLPAAVETRQLEGKLEGHGESFPERSESDIDVIGVGQQCRNAQLGPREILRVREASAEPSCRFAVVGAHTRRVHLHLGP